MRKLFWLTLISLLWLTLISLLIAGPAMAQDWSGRGRIKGTVTDEDGNPLEGVEISLETVDTNQGPEADIVTDAKGEWKFLGLHGTTWKITALLDGYKKTTDNIEVSTLGPFTKSQIKMPEISGEEKARRRQVRAKQLADAGNQLLQSGDYVGARQLYERSLEYVRQEDQPNILLTMAETYGVEENHDKAIEMLEKALAIDANHEGSLRLMVATLAALGRDDDAKTYIARLPQEFQFNPSTFFNMGITKYNAGDMAGALADFDRALTHAPEMAEGYYFRGLAHLNQGNNDTALADLKKFKELVPDDPKIGEVDGFIEYLESQ